MVRTNWNKKNKFNGLLSSINKINICVVSWFKNKCTHKQMWVCECVCVPTHNQLQLILIILSDCSFSYFFFHCLRHSLLDFFICIFPFNQWQLSKRCKCYRFTQLFIAFIIIINKLDPFQRRYHNSATIVWKPSSHKPKTITIILNKMNRIILCRKHEL